MHALQVAWHYFVLVSPWVIVAAVPSALTAMTQYPADAGAEMRVKWLLNVFSLLTHADSPGTLKWPLAMSKPPVGALVAKQ
jgi:hypothetical protein